MYLHALRTLSDLIQSEKKMIINHPNKYHDIYFFRCKNNTQQIRTTNRSLWALSREKSSLEPLELRLLS